MYIKRVLPILLLFSGSALAQYTVTATVTDTPDGQTWNNGTYNITFYPTAAAPSVPPGTPTTYSGSLDGSGAFSQALPTITANGASWTFTICPDATVVGACPSTVLLISGSASISSLLSAIAKSPRFPASYTAYGYADSEVFPLPPAGGPGYFNVTSGKSRQWTGSAWQDWGGGGSLPSAPGAGYIPVSTGAGTIYAAGIAVPTFNVANLSNVHYANQWCTTPGTLDDTCISNAVTDIVAHGPASILDSLPMGSIVVPPGVYTINNTITLPATAHITLVGQLQGTYAGVTFQTGATPPNPMIQVNEAGAVINHIAFNGNGTSGAAGTTNAIQVGTSSIVGNDDHINWNWFRGLYAGLHLVNSNGLDMSHNTSDAYSNYLAYTNQPGGDVLMTDTIGIGLRCFGAEIACLALTGNNTVSFAINQFQGIFDNGTGPNAYIQLTNMLDTSIQGQFYNNAGGDISTSGGTAYNVGPAQFYNSGKTSVSFASSTNASLTDSTFLNSAIGTASGTVPMISCTGCIGYTIARNTSTTLSGGHGYASYGLYVDAASTGEIYGNNFNSQVTAPYDVLDVSTRSGFQVGGGALVINGTGNPSVASTTALIQNVASNYSELEGFGANNTTVPDMYLTGKSADSSLSDFYIHCVYNTNCTFSDPLVAKTLSVVSSRKGTFVCTNGGTITISNTNELVTSDVIISLNTAGGTITTSPAMKTVTSGTGFTVLCGASDTSTYNYDILN